MALQNTLFLGLGGWKPEALRLQLAQPFKNLRLKKRIRLVKMLLRYRSLRVKLKNILSVTYVPERFLGG